MPQRSFGLVDYKVKEAEYFLLELQRVGRKRDLFAVQFCASAFTSAARSVTFAMQSSLNDHPTFMAWYTPRQQRLRFDPLARFFHEFRRVTQHKGEQVVNEASLRKKGAKYYFVPCVDLRDVPDQDVESACEDHFRLILRLVYDCYVDLAPIVNAQWRYTSDYFACLGKTIEDAEEEFGLPRGWTDIIGRPKAEPYRWEALRRQTDGCGLLKQFDRWLGCTLPEPEPLPPFPG